MAGPKKSLSNRTGKSREESLRNQEQPSSSLFDGEKPDEPAKRKFTLAIEVIRADDKAILLRCTYGEIELENEYRTLYVDHQPASRLCCNAILTAHMRIENVDEIKKSYPTLFRTCTNCGVNASGRRSIRRSMKRRNRKSSNRIYRIFCRGCSFSFYSLRKDSRLDQAAKIQGELSNPYSYSKPYPSDIE